MDTVSNTSDPQRVTYDARGLAEPDAVAPEIAEIDRGHAVFDAEKLSTRQINLELRRLVYQADVRDIRINNPGAKHSIATGILARCHITIDGSLGYFGCALLDGPEVHVTGRVGWSSAENMMSGVLVIDRNAGSLTGAGLRGGDLVVRTDVGARTGIDQKGGTIVIGGNAGTMTGFMMQRGHQIICGDAGPGMGDSMYDGAIYLGGTVTSLGVDCVESDMSTADREFVDRKLHIYGVANPGTFRKFVCGKKLWNYDNLEPSERKLVL